MKPKHIKPAKAKAKAGPRRTRDTRPSWPAGKALPSFKSEADELDFWRSHSFAADMEAGGEPLVFEPNATRHPRSHVYTVRLDEREAATLQALAKRRGVPASVVIREFVRAQMPQR